MLPILIAYKKRDIALIMPFHGICVPLLLVDKCEKLRNARNLGMKIARHPLDIYIPARTTHIRAIIYQYTPQYIAPHQ